MVCCGPIDGNTLTSPGHGERTTLSISMLSPRIKMEDGRTVVVTRWCECSEPRIAFRGRCQTRKQTRDVEGRCNSCSAERRKQGGSQHGVGDDLMKSEDCRRCWADWPLQVFHASICHSSLAHPRAYQASAVKHKI